jgi:hypothetical protein
MALAQSPNSALDSTLFLSRAQTTRNVFSTS